MPWNSNNGGNGQNGGGSRGPWGQGPSGGGGRGQQPPDLEELLKRGRDQFGSLVPGGRAGFLVIGLIAIVLWGFSGLYRVGAAENGYVLRFGEHVSTTQPGLNWHIPYPFETVVTLGITEQYSIDVGLDDNERLMLTGDENIVDIKFTIQYLIVDGAKYLFNVDDQRFVIQSTGESAMREVVGQSEFLILTTTGREQAQRDVVESMQSILNTYNLGVLVTEINFGDVNPHRDAVDAARDVQAAKADRERLQNEAQTYANSVVPIAEGEALRILADAEAYKQQTIAEAEGQAQRFISVYEEYRLAPSVTRQRMFLETMEDVLGGTQKIILDENGSGVVPYLPLDQLNKKSSQ
jgi:membrane protease subunit HflK